MTYTAKGEERGAYRALCAAADRNEAIVKLSHKPDGLWGLQVILGPTEADPAWRAAGSLFPNISELDPNALVLLKWLRNHTERPKRGRGAG